MPRPADVGEWVNGYAKASIPAGGAVHLYYWGVPSPHLRQRSPRATHLRVQSPVHLSGTRGQSESQATSKAFYFILKSLFGLFVLVFYNIYGVIR